MRLWSTCSHSVQGELYIYMELMRMSLDKAYLLVRDSRRLVTSERVMKKISYSIVVALGYLKKEFNILHRGIVLPAVLGLTLTAAQTSSQAMFFLDSMVWSSSVTLVSPKPWNK